MLLPPTFLSFLSLLFSPPLHLPLFLCQSPLALLTNCLFMFFKSQTQDTSMGQDCDTLLKLQYHRTDSWQCFAPNIIVKDAASYKEESFHIQSQEQRLSLWQRNSCQWHPYFTVTGILFFCHSEQKKPPTVFNGIAINIKSPSSFFPSILVHQNRDEPPVQESSSSFH